jgi:bifunctional non-homologous end joining protein LigD
LSKRKSQVDMKKNLLKEYDKKRDFKLTKEPSGTKKVTKKSKKLSFVVQEHHASHLHYDFRLEMEGVLKSWAVPKGPSLDPKDKRLAVQTEDHPLAYGKFHGTIPNGEYGGGEVFIWDKGTWTPKDDHYIEALKKGRLEFTLDGDKLHGGFILVRTHYKETSTKKNWLLIKRTDEETKIMKKKTSRKKKAQDFVAPELPRLVSEVPTGKDWIHEMKYDGYRMQAHVQNGLVQFYTRNGLDWSQSFPFILDSLGRLDVDDVILDGEVVALDEDGRSHFQRLQNSLKSHDDKNLRYYVFDLLFLNGEDWRERTLIERKEKLEEVLKGAHKELIYSQHLLEKGEEFFKMSCEHHLEGIVSKQASSTYASGRHDEWVKTKCGHRQEFVIGGWTEPQGTRPGLGSLLLGVFEKNKFRYVGRVGTGFNSATLRTLVRNLIRIERDESPFDLKSPKGKDLHWVNPKLICEVSFSQWTDDKVLRTPVFMGMREDKKPEVIHMEKAKKISSPDKILFKDEKLTKQDIADYYQKVAPKMLPYVKGRPLSLVRCPHGGEEKCFFQKHISGSIPESFHPLQITEEKGEGTYITIDSPPGLKELVQLNAFEIHTWNSHEDYLSPDQIVMDFDPGPGMTWKQVVAGAFELKEILEDLDLKSFVKLTGGKGVHVHIPLAPLYDWGQVKTFSQTIAQEMVSRHPELYVATMSKKLRKNKIFIDYLRNGYGATAVAPYSLRARAHSSVALPIDWSELKKIKSPDEFTLPRALRKIQARKKDPWEGMMKLKQKIKILKPSKSKKVS